MKINPKLSLGLILATVAFGLLTLLIFQKQTSKLNSTLSIIGENNNFKLSLNLNKTDRQSFNSFVENLLDLSYPEKDLNFTLDATSTSSLAFKTPISAEFKSISPKNLEMVGEIKTRLTMDKLQLEKIKAPKETELIITAPDLSGFAFSKLKIDNASEQTLKQQIKPLPGTYLISFNSGQEFAFFYKQNLSLENNESILEATTASNEKQTKFYKIKIQTKGQNLSTDPVLFQKDGFNVLASSLDMANEIINSNEEISLNESQLENDLNFILKPKKEFDAPKFSSFLAGNGINSLVVKAKLEEALAKVDTLAFSLKGTTFSALINLK